MPYSSRETELARSSLAAAAGAPKAAAEAVAPVVGQRRAG